MDDFLLIVSCSFCRNDVVPIVMGGRPEDYLKMAPKHSYIHVDDFAHAKDLADYLMKLDKNETLYNEYHRWRDTGTFINTKFWCRLCAMLHGIKDRPPTWLDNIETWWRKDVCRRTPWGNKRVQTDSIS